MHNLVPMVRSCEKKPTYKDYRGVYETISQAGGVIAIMICVGRAAKGMHN